MNLQKASIWLFAVWLTVLLSASGCSVTRHVPSDAVVVSRTRVEVDGKPTGNVRLQQAVQEKPYHRTFGLLPIAAWIWHSDTLSGWHRFRGRMGSAPTLMTVSGQQRTMRQMERIMHQQGFTQAHVAQTVRVTGRKASLTYRITSGEPRVVERIDWQVVDDGLRALIGQGGESLLRPGMRLDRQMLEAERTRVLDLMRSQGYWGFNKEDVRYVADTVDAQQTVVLTVVVEGWHRPYTIGDVRFVMADGQPQHIMREAVLRQHCFLQPGQTYDEQNVRQTYSALSRLHLLKYSRVQLTPDTAGQLDVRVMLMPQPTNGLNFELDGTNTSGDLGFAAALTYMQRNLFRGSEAYTATVRGGYERLSGNVAGLVNDNYSEYAFDNSLEFPKFVFPFLSADQHRRFRATTQVNASYQFQTRPEYTRQIAQGAFSYRWLTRGGRRRHEWDLARLSYVSLPRKSEAFMQIVREAGPIIWQGYSDHLILAMRYSLSLGNAGLTGMTSSRPALGRDVWALHISPEIAGNVLQGMSSLFDAPSEDGRYQLFSLPFEQYARVDADWSYSRYLTDRSRLAFHVAGGLAVPYGNSKVMPFEKRYYAGGANSVRGWSVRALGPGRYRTERGMRAGYINQCGDVRLDASVELRSKLFWKFEGAAFIDAGNVWTIDDYEMQPGGVFSADFYREIAASWGVGLRMVTDFVILRLDLGLKAYDPASTSGWRWPLRHPLSGESRTLHFAVGYPF